jgi:ferredoxin
VELLAELPTRPASEPDLAATAAVVDAAGAAMGRWLDTEGVRDLLVHNPDHPRWDDVAARCLACGNCTLVCPTCFCTTTEDRTSLDGATAERWRRWDSCFSLDFSYAAGGIVRSSIRSRYRQWLTHKLATWWDQFGESGCVGCGRCIAWCPVGIDLTEEVAAIRDGMPNGGAGVPVAVARRGGGGGP